MTPNINQQSSKKALIPFTGFYTLDASIGSFFMVDTNMSCTIPNPGAAPVCTYNATITISSDGQTSEQFLWASNWIFDDTNLVIPDAAGGTIANLNFSNTSGAISVSGTIYGNEVSGSTPFGPVQLSLWNGTYYAQGSAYQIHDQLVYPYIAALQVNPDGTVLFGSDGNELQPVQSYWYDYGMFVIGLQIDPTKPLLFEMGTSSGWGRVAGNAEHGQMLVSIQLQEPVPNL